MSWREIRRELRETPQQDWRDLRHVIGERIAATAFCWTLAYAIVTGFRFMLGTYL